MDLDDFESHRGRLLRVAYRMLGCMTEAEDLVQDAYLRWHESDRSEVRAVAAVLVKTVVRLAIDRQRRLKLERDCYQGNWLPEPWPGDGSGAAERADDMSYASMVLLERLSADERAAFLLREMFDYDYDMVARSLEKTEPACRKLVQRAKERLAEPADGGQPRGSANAAAKNQLLAQLMAATRAPTAAELESLLAPTGRLVSDGGGKAFAARYPVLGASNVARTMWRFFRKYGERLEQRLVSLGGEPVLVTHRDGRLYAASMVAADDARIHELYMMLNPDKLTRIERLLPGL